MKLALGEILTPYDPLLLDNFEIKLTFAFDVKIINDHLHPNKRNNLN